MIKFSAYDGSDIFLDPSEFSEIYWSDTNPPYACIGMKNGHSFGVKEAMTEVLARYKATGYQVWTDDK